MTSSMLISKKKICPIAKKFCNCIKHCKGFNFNPNSNKRKCSWKTDSPIETFTLFYTVAKFFAIGQIFFLEIIIETVIQHFVCVTFAYSTTSLIKTFIIKRRTVALMFFDLTCSDQFHWGKYTFQVWPTLAMIFHNSHSTRLTFLLI